MKKHRCGAWTEKDGNTHWRVWAPRAERLELVLLNGSQRRPQLMQREEQGFFHCLLPDVPEGQRYAYRLNNGPERPDPRSLWQPDGVHNPSAVVRPERFAWT